MLVIQLVIQLSIQNNYNAATHVVWTKKNNFSSSGFCFHLLQPLKNVSVLLSVGHRKRWVSWDYLGS